MDRSEEIGEAPILPTVIETVAAAKDVDPTALKPPLYEILDADHLAGILDNEPVAVSFRYAGVWVEIVDGTVYVQDARPCAFHSAGPAE